jgi:hypothetical protein
MLLDVGDPLLSGRRRMRAGKAHLPRLAVLAEQFDQAPPLGARRAPEVGSIRAGAREEFAPRSAYRERSARDQ